VRRLHRHPLLTRCIAMWKLPGRRPAGRLHSYLLVACCLTVLSHCLSKETPRKENSMGRLIHASSNAGFIYCSCCSRTFSLSQLLATGTLDSSILFFFLKTREGLVVRLTCRHWRQRLVWRQKLPRLHTTRCCCFWKRLALSLSHDIRGFPHLMLH
jgi:hypothetical protein